MSFYPRMFIIWTVLFILLLLFILASNYWSITVTGRWILAGFYFFGICQLAWEWYMDNTVITGRAFNPLLKLGFEFETRRNYWGYKGTYQNYFIRVHYDRDSPSYGPGGRFMIILYHVAPTNREWKEWQQKVKKKYKNGWSPFVNPRFTIRQFDIVRSGPFGLFDGFTKIKKQMDFTVAVAKAEGAQPIIESQAEAIIQDNPNLAPFGHYDDFIK